MAPIIQFMAKGSKPIKAFHVLTEAAINLIEQRRAEKEPGKVSTMTCMYAMCERSPNGHHDLILGSCM